MIFMKGNEKKERESRKKAEKEALEKAKKEEEVREAKRAARKLNFLITQTELYSHFVGNKIKSEFRWTFHPLSTLTIAPPAYSERSRGLRRYRWCRSNSSSAPECLATCRHRSWRCARRRRAQGARL